MNARFDALEGAGHFLQNTHGKEIVDLIVVDIRSLLCFAKRAPQEKILRGPGLHIQSRA